MEQRRGESVRDRREEEGCEDSEQEKSTQARTEK
jgi:hypothetical protein